MNKNDPTVRRPTLTMLDILMYDHHAKAFGPANSKSD